MLEIHKVFLHISSIRTHQSCANLKRQLRELFYARSISKNSAFATNENGFLPGSVKANFSACKNNRFKPFDFENCLSRSRSPYFTSPTIGKPSSDTCTRI